MGLAVVLAGIAFRSLVLLYLLSAFAVHHPLVLAFEFSYTAPTQCDDLNISWSGGRGPFSLLITQPFTPPLNISIPDSAVDASSGNGSFSTLLSLTTKSQFLLTMSDADGFGTGGTSGVLQVGSSISGTNCNTTPNKPDFTFQANDALAECRSFSFSDFGGAVQPITILGLIPLGQPFFFIEEAGKNLSTFAVQQVPLTNGTSVVFIMMDSKDRQGGSTSLLTVSQSDDSSCINATTPHSTAEASTQTSAPTSNTILSASSGVKPGQIVGAVIGGLALAGIVVLLLVYFLRRKGTRGKGESVDMLSPGAVFISNGGSSRVSRMRSSLLPAGRRQTAPPIDLLPSQARPQMLFSPYYPSSSTLPPRDEYEPSPYILPSETSARDGHSDQNGPLFNLRHSQWSGLYTVGSDPRSASHSRSNSEGPISPTTNLLPNPYAENTRHARQPSVPYSVNSGKGSSSGTIHNNPRLILHTDADDISTSDDTEGVIELPPQYTERRPTSNVPIVEKQRRPSNEDP